MDAEVDCRYSSGSPFGGSLSGKTALPTFTAAPAPDKAREPAVVTVPTPMEATVVTAVNAAHPANAKHASKANVRENMTMLRSMC